MSKALQYATPESVGISSKCISRFIDHLAEMEMPIHSFAIARFGKVAAECYYKPFDADFYHRMYSTSKTFVSMAIGLLYTEGKIRLCDKIADYFPEKLPAEPHRFLTEMTIRDLLMMATCHSGSTYSDADKDWVWTFFNRKPSHPSGTIFSYDTSATVTLNALVEKLSGENIIDFLRPRLFDPLGMSDGIWAIQRPEGGAWGGSGFMLRTADLLRFAMFLMNKGMWEGRQLIARDYMEAATSKQIDNHVSNSNPEHSFGYGFQIWRTRNNGFACLGMGTQIAVCLPDKQLCYVVTADTQHIAAGDVQVMTAFWEDIYDKMSDARLNENPAAYAALCEKSRALTLNMPNGGTTENPAAENWNGKSYVMEPNRMKLSSVRFTFGEKTGCMEYSNATGAKKIEFRFGAFQIGEFGELGYYDRVIGTPGGRAFRCAATAKWTDENSLILYVHIIDNCFGTLKIDVHFCEGGISMLMSKTAEWFLNEYYGFAAGREAETE